MKNNGTVRTCISRYLAHLAATASGSHASYRSTLAAFVSRWPNLEVQAVRPHHLTTWLDGMERWNAGSRYTAWGRVLMALAWNKAAGHIGDNPLSGAKRPARYRRSARGADCVLPPPLSSLLLSTACGPFRSFVLALARTGARPAELSHAVAANYRRDWRAIVHRADEEHLFRHKTANQRKSGQTDRIIHLEGETETHVKRHARAGGFLFPFASGERWTPGRIRTHWLALLSSPSVSDWLHVHGHARSRVVPYSFRHTWITTALLRGTPLIVVATLAGTSAAMIERHYSHVGADVAAMRKAYLASL